MEINQISDLAIKAAYKVSNTLGPGFIESVYVNALCIELKKLNLHIDYQQPICVFYDGQSIGEFKPDILVEKSLILEIKAVARLALAHEFQLVNYLKATQIDNGLLLNFGVQQIEIRRKFRTQAHKQTQS
jgi:GxxExxY protein